MALRKAPIIEPIQSDQRFATNETILRTLEHGLSAIDAEADALRIEEHLGMQPRDGSQPRRNSRDRVLQARLDKHRATRPAQAAAEPAAGELPETVATALEIIRGSRPPSRVGRKKLIEQLEADHDVIRAAIFAQHEVVDELRNELSASMAAKLIAAHRDLILTIFRGAQALAAATDAEAEFRRSVIDAGYAWRADLLRGPQLRAALVLGSESTFDSDISRARRMLEELKIL